MGKEPWRRNHGDILEEESWGRHYRIEKSKKNQARGIQEETHPGGRNQQEESWKRIPG